MTTAMRRRGERDDRARIRMYGDERDHRHARIRSRRAAIRRAVTNTRGRRSPPLETARPHRDRVATHARVAAPRLSPRPAAARRRLVIFACARATHRVALSLSLGARHGGGWRWATAARERWRRRRRRVNGGGGGGGGIYTMAGDAGRQRDEFVLVAMGRGSFYCFVIQSSYGLTMFKWYLI